MDVYELKLFREEKFLYISDFKEAKTSVFRALLRIRKLSRFSEIVRHFTGQKMMSDLSIQL